MWQKSLVLTALLAVGFPAAGQAVPRAESNEVQITGGYFRSIGTGGGNFNTDMGYGYFLTKDWEVGVRQGINYNLVENASDDWIATTSPFLEYHFMNEGQTTPTLLPFLGGFVGAVWNEDDFTGTVGPSGGVKYFFHDQTFLTARYRYEWFFDEINEVNDTIDSNHVVTFGLGYVWG